MDNEDPEVPFLLIKEEIAINQHFLLNPKWFLLFQKWFLLYG